METTGHRGARTRGPDSRYPFLARWDYQKPHQQSKEDQCADQGKQRVQRVKVEVRIPVETMANRQHTALLCAVEVRERGRQPEIIVPPNPASGCCFLWRCDRPLPMPEKIAIVTGTSSGFGLLTSVELAKAGFGVVATMRDLNRRNQLDGAATQAQVAERIDVRVLDVTAFSSMAGFVEQVVRDHGRIDVLINNAGFAVAGFAEDIQLEELRRQFETNFFGTVAMTKAVLPVMRKQHAGHIIQVSSINGLHGAMTVSSYVASKHALEGWSESLRLEVNALGIKVVLVEPGAYQTDIWTRGAVMGKHATQPESPNFKRSLRMRERIGRLPKADPIAVARLMVGIAQNPNPKLRYLVGRDARMTLALKRLLPWKWHERLVANFMKID